MRDQVTYVRQNDAGQEIERALRRGRRPRGHVQEHHESAEQPECERDRGVPAQRRTGVATDQRAEPERIAELARWRGPRERLPENEVAEYEQHGGLAGGDRRGMVELHAGILGQAMRQSARPAPAATAYDPANPRVWTAG